MEGSLNNKSINLDITHKCTLECPRCPRKLYDKVPGHDMSISEYRKIISYFNHINFCGNISDPVLNPNFIEFLRINYDFGIPCNVHNAATGKKLTWYKEAFNTNPKAKWFFGLDGLPNESHKYRVNQKGYQLFEAMKLSSIMNINSTWRMIVFKFNEDHIEQCRKLANDIGINFQLVKSSRFKKNDPLKPTKFYIERDYEKSIPKVS